MPGKLHGQSLAGCSPWGHKSQTRLNMHTLTVLKCFTSINSFNSHSNIITWGVLLLYSLFFSLFQERKQGTGQKGQATCAKLYSFWGYSMTEICLSHVRIWTCVKFICLTIMLSYLRHAVLSHNILNTQCLNFCNNPH